MSISKVKELKELQAQMGQDKFLSLLEAFLQEKGVQPQEIERYLVKNSGNASGAEVARCLGQAKLNRAVSEVVRMRVVKLLTTPARPVSREWVMAMISAMNRANEADIKALAASLEAERGQQSSQKSSSISCK